MGSSFSSKILGSEIVLGYDCHSVCYIYVDEFIVYINIMVLLLSLMDLPSFLMYYLFILYPGIERCKFKYSSKYMTLIKPHGLIICWWRRTFKMQKCLGLKTVNIWVHEYLLSNFLYKLIKETPRKFHIKVINLNEWLRIK